MRRVLLGLCLILGGLSGCSTVQKWATPMCDSESIEALVLAAQSVPTASRVPCIERIPAGWELNTVNIRSGLTSMTLDNDRAGFGALKVEMHETCDVAGATQVTSDEAGTSRYERIISIDNGFKSERTYVYDGGCTTYRFNFSERGQALVNEASIFVAFATRDDIDQRFREDRNDHAKL